MASTQPSRYMAKENSTRQALPLILLIVAALPVVGCSRAGQARASTDAPTKPHFRLLWRLGPHSEHIRALHVGLVYDYYLQITGPEKQELPTAAVPRVVFEFEGLARWARLDSTAVRGAGFNYCNLQSPRAVRFSNGHTAIDFGRCDAFDLFFVPIKPGHQHFDVRTDVVRVRDGHYQILETPRWGMLHWGGAVRR